MELIDKKNIMNELGMLHKDIVSVIEQAQNVAYRSVNLILTKRNWLLGKRIISDNFNNEDRATYGKQVVKELSAMLSATYGESFSETNLYHFIDFARTFPDIFYIDRQKFHTLCGESAISNMPTQEALRREIEQQKTLFKLPHVNRLSH